MAFELALNDGRTMTATRENRKTQVRLQLKLPSMSSGQLREFCRNATSVNGVRRAEKYSSKQVVVTLVAESTTPDRNLKPIINQLKGVLESVLDRNTRDLVKSRSRRGN